MPDHGQAVRLMTAAYVLTGMRVRREMLSIIYDGVKIMHETSAWDEVEASMVKGELRILLKIGRQQLGEPDDKTEAALAKILDPDRLERMAGAVLTVNSWKALLSVK